MQPSNLEPAAGAWVLAWTHRRDALVFINTNKYPPPGPLLPLPISQNGAPFVPSRESPSFFFHSWINTENIGSNVNVWPGHDTRCPSPPGGTWRDSNASIFHWTNWLSPGHNRGESGDVVAENGKYFRPVGGQVERGRDRAHNQRLMGGGWNEIYAFRPHSDFVNRIKSPISPSIGYDVSNLLIS